MLQSVDGDSGMDMDLEIDGESAHTDDLDPDAVESSRSSVPP